MKFLIRNSSWILLALTFFWNFEYTIEAFFAADGVSDLSNFIVSKNLRIVRFVCQRNRAHLDRLTCRTFPGSKVFDVRCRLKYIDRNHLKGDLWANLSQPIKGLWVHAIMYYRYNTYQKIATEYWDDLCKWVNGRSNSYVMTYLMPLLKKYSNFVHPCPYSGLIYAKSDNVSVQALTIPQIMPAGRYKVDFNYTEGDRKTVLVAASLYGTISDHRIEVV